MPNLTPVFSDPAPTCPECGGRQLLDHPAGLVFAHDTMAGCTLQDAEDSRAVADLSLAGARGWPFEREATSAERTLLAAAGHELPDDALTVVDWLTKAVRRRRWPDLEPDETAPSSVDSLSNAVSAAAGATARMRGEA